MVEGKTEWIEHELSYVLAFSRVSDTEKITFVGNFSKDQAKLEVGSGEILLSNGAVIADGEATLSAYGYAIIKN